MTRLVIEFGPEVLPLANRLAPHLRTAADVREAATIVREAFAG